MEELSGADVAALLPDATSSAAGLMSAAYAAKLDGISAGADATGFLGNLTTAQIEALTGLSAWQWAWDTTLLRRMTWTGSLWLPEGGVIMQNRTGASSVRGYSLKQSTVYDNAVALPGSDSSVNVIAIMYTAGVANGGDVVVMPVSCGKLVQILVWNGTAVARGNFFTSFSDGTNWVDNSAAAGNFCKAVEAKSNTGSPQLVWALATGIETY